MSTQDARPERAIFPGLAAGLGRFLLRRHKIVAGVVVALVVAITVVHVTSRPASPSSASAVTGAPSSTLAHGFTVAEVGQPGKTVSTSQYSGRPLIVNFWASWCTPCQQETPLLAAFYKAHGGHVAIVGLDENDSAASALKFANSKGVAYPLGADAQLNVADAYGVAALPQTFFLNASHHIVQHIYGALTQAELARGVRLMDAGKG